MRYLVCSLGVFFLAACGTRPVLQTAGPLDWDEPFVARTADALPSVDSADAHRLRFLLADPKCAYGANNLLRKFERGEPSLEDIVHQAQAYVRRESGQPVYDERTADIIRQAAARFRERRPKLEIWQFAATECRRLFLDIDRERENNTSPRDGSASR
jgi:hypothetical protein